MKRYIDAVNKIESVYIRHRIAKETINLLYASAILSADSEMVFLVGLTRAGKSRLVREIRKLLNFPDVDIDAPDSVSVGLRASNCSTDGAFSTKSFAKRFINALKHPIHSDEARQQLGTQGGRDPYESEMWQTIENAVTTTNKRFICIDEAQNICRARGAASPGAILDAWKCFAETTNTVLIVSATYEILSAMQSATHIIGRQSVVHYPPYFPNKSDIQEFNDIINTFDQYFPRHHSLSKLEDHCEFLFKGSMGCVGLLSKWLRRALTLAMASNSDVTMKMLLQSRLSDNYLNLLQEDLTEGLEMLKNKDLISNGSEEIGRPSEEQTDLVLQTILSGRAEAAANRSRSRNNKPFTCKAKRREAGERVPGEVYV